MVTTALQSAGISSIAIIASFPLCGPATAALELLAAATGARVVAAWGLLVQGRLDRVSFAGPFHHADSRSAVPPQLVGHKAHVGIDVPEVHFVPLAQVVEAVLATWGFGKAVFGAAAVAGEAVVAFDAVLGQRVLFVLTELGLLRAGDHVADALLVDVAQAIIRIDEVVAGVQVAVVLDDQRLAAGLGEDAQARILAQPRAERHVKKLHKDLADVVAHPFVKDRAEELAVLPRAYRPFGDRRSALVFGID